MRSSPHSLAEKIPARRAGALLLLIALFPLSGAKCRNERATAELTLSPMEIGIDPRGNMKNQRTLVYLGNEVDSARVKITTTGFNETCRLQVKDIEPGTAEEITGNVENREAALSGRVFMLEADYEVAGDATMVLSEIKVQAGTPWHPGEEIALKNKPLSVALPFGQAVDMLSLPDRPSQFFFTLNGTSGKELEMALEGRAKVYITTPEEGFVREASGRTPDFESGADGAFFPINFDRSRDRLLVSVLTEGVADSTSQWMRMVVAESRRKIDLRVRLVGNSSDYGSSAEATTEQMREIIGRTSARLFRATNGALRIGKVDYVVGVHNHPEFKANVTFTALPSPGAEAFADMVYRHVMMAKGTWEMGAFYLSQILAHELLHTQMRMPDEYLETEPTCGTDGLQRGDSEPLCPHSYMAVRGSVRLCTPADHIVNQGNPINGLKSMWEILDEEVGVAIPSDSASPILFWFEGVGDESKRSLMRLPVEVARH